MFETDLVIIGAGPVGLFAIFQAGMLKIRSHIIDSLETIGGQCSALYPEKPIYDIPAHPQIFANDLVARLKEQAEPFQPTYHLNQRVETLQKENGGFIVTTSKATKIKCKAIIIAAGCGAFGPNRPPLNGVEDYEGKSIFYAVTSRSQFANKSVVIAGGGDSAVDWAISLAQVAKKIFVIHRRDKFRCTPDSADKLKELAKTDKLDLITPFQLEGLEGRDGQLQQVLVKDFDGNVRRLEADYLLPFFGLSMELGPIINWNLELEKKHILVDNSTMQTSQQGIYAIGDIATYNNKLKLILTGFAEAASACHHLYKIIYPDQIFHFEYSTSKGASL